MNLANRQAQQEQLRYLKEIRDKLIIKIENCFDAIREETQFGIVNRKVEYSRFPGLIVEDEIGQNANIIANCMWRTNFVDEFLWLFVSNHEITLEIPMGSIILRASPDIDKLENLNIITPLLDKIWEDHPELIQNFDHKTLLQAGPAP